MPAYAVRRGPELEEGEGSVILKVPKREIFDRSDFHDFYTIKSLCVGDFGVKITNFLNNS